MLKFKLVQSNFAPLPGLYDTRVPATSVREIFVHREEKPIFRILKPTSTVTDLGLLTSRGQLEEQGR